MRCPGGCILALFSAPLVDGFVLWPSVHTTTGRPAAAASGWKRNRERGIVGSAVSQDVERTSDKTIDEDTLSKLSTCQTGTAARNVLERALGVDNESTALYASIQIPRGASERPLSDTDLAIQTNIRNARYSVMDLIELNGDRDADRASLALLCLMVGSTASALVANQSLPGPEIVRFAVVWLLSFAPLIFVGYGIATPADLQTLLVTVQKNIFPTYRKRMIQHEAGHFLLGHLLGLPIKTYQANAVKNAVEFYPLNDADVGRERAKQLGFEVRRNSESAMPQRETVDETSESRPYFSEGSRGENAVLTQSVYRNAKNYTDNPFLKLPTQNEPTNAWPYRGFDHETLDKLSVVSVAGVCAEILAFGNAEGGYADLCQLRQLFNSAEPEISEKEMENRIRFALGYGMSQLRRHLGALDALAEVMEQGGSVADCVQAIEGCDNVKGGNALVGDYERIRRETFRREGVGAVEQLLLGGGKNVDMEDNSVIEGKGGGERKSKFAMTGDDPLYAALGAAGIFFVWASTGGLSLH